MSEIRPRRSVLAMPGSNARALEKARSLPADVILIDLEDGTAPAAKAAARAQVDRKSTRLNSSHSGESRMPSSA